MVSSRSNFMLSVNEMIEIQTAAHTAYFAFGESSKVSRRSVFIFITLCGLCLGARSSKKKKKKKKKEKK